MVDLDCIAATVAAVVGWKWWENSSSHPHQQNHHCSWHYELVMTSLEYRVVRSIHGAVVAAVKYVQCEW